MQTDSKLLFNKIYTILIVLKKKSEKLFVLWTYVIWCVTYSTHKNKLGLP